MKIKNLFGLGMAVLLTSGTYMAKAQGMSVNSTGAAANSSAILDVSSTTQGMLVPRMTNAQLTAIPVGLAQTGLLVYQTDVTTGFYFYNGSSWVSLNNAVGTAGGDLTGSYPNPTISSSASTGNDIISSVNASGGGLSGTKLATNSVSVNAMSATGTRNSTTYLRGDNTWSTVSGGSGTVTSVSSGVLTSGTTAFTDTVFTTTISAPTTTPSINYHFTNAAPYTVLTNSVSAATTPVYGKVMPQTLFASSGTPGSSTFYCGNGTWATPTGVSFGNFTSTSASNYAVQTTDGLVYTTNGTITFTLPAANLFVPGKAINFAVVTAGSANVTFQAASGNVLYETASGSISGSGGSINTVVFSMMVISDGISKWFIQD